MKRKSLCAFALVFWVFLLCTILSYRVEEWMTPWVDSVSVGVDEKTQEYYLPLNALEYEDDMPVLYEIVEGTGWESGSQLKAVDPSRYVILPEKRIIVTMHFGNPFLHYSSKGFRDLELVNVTPKAPEKEDDMWLLMVPQGTFDLEKFPSSMEVEAQDDHAMLVSAANATVPFISGRAKNEILFRQTDLPKEFFWGWEVYSLGEVEKMLASLPLLAVLAAGMLFSVGLWAVSCFLSRNARKNRVLLLSNIGICAAMLVALPFFLRTIELPSSLLPQMNLFEAAHYQTEFREIFSSLTDLAASGSQAAAATLASADQAKFLFFGVLSAGVVLLAAVIFAEIFLAKKRNAPNGKREKE